MRRATVDAADIAGSDHISIHALREESDRVRGNATAMLVISIHALREESDFHLKLYHDTQNISIHALREESDDVSNLADWSVDAFQSTLSVRRATRGNPTMIHPSQFQSTLSVRRATAQMDSMFHIVEHLSFVQVQE